MFENFEIRTIFKCDGVEYCLSSLNNQFYSIYFDKSEEHVKVYLEPKQTLILIKFALLLDIQLDKDCLIYENTFYNQITSKEYRIGDLKDSEKPIKVSNSEIKNFDIDYGKFKSYSFTRIKRNNDEMVLGSLDESNGFTVFGLDTPNNLLVIEKDVIGLKINKEIEILNVKCYGNSGTNQFHSYFKELGLKKKHKGKEICLDINMKEFSFDGFSDLIEEFKKRGGDIVNLNMNFLSTEEISEDSLKFFNRAEDITELVKSLDLKIGITFSPFIYIKNSFVYNFVKSANYLNENKKPILLNGSYLLNFYSREGKEFLNKIITDLSKKFKIDMITIDNFYAVCFPFRKDHTRGGTACEVMKYLRNLCENIELCVSRAPLVPAIGIADLINCGSVLTEKWKYPKFSGRQSTKHALISSLYKSLINEFFVQYQSFIIKHFDKSNYDYSLVKLVACATSDILFVSESSFKDISFRDYKKNDYVIKSVAVKENRYLDVVFTQNTNYNFIKIDCRKGKIKYL